MNNDDGVRVCFPRCDRVVRTWGSRCLGTYRYVPPYLPSGMPCIAWLAGGRVAGRAAMWFARFYFFLPAHVPLSTHTHAHPPFPRDTTLYPGKDDAT